jgi:DNA-binding NtrC family response regulator
MVVDNEKLIRWTIDQLLSPEGYEIEAAATAAEALRLSAKNRFDLILADPEACGEHPETFFGEIREKQAGAALVILTAIPRDAAGTGFDRFGAFRILEKPFDAEEIYAAAREALGSRKLAGDPNKED